MKNLAELGAIAAWHAGANMVALFRGAGHGGLSWAGLGVEYAVERREEVMASLARFVRAYPSAPPESLYRYAHGQGFVDLPGVDLDKLQDSWRHLPMHARLAYEAFATSLVAFDKAIANELALARAELAAMRNADGTVPLAADREKIPDEDRMDGLLPDPLAKVSYARAEAKAEPAGEVVTNEWRCEFCEAKISGRDFKCSLCGVPRPPANDERQGDGEKGAQANPEPAPAAPAADVQPVPGDAQAAAAPAAPAVATPAAAAAADDGGAADPGAQAEAEAGGISEAEEEIAQREAAAREKPKHKGKKHN